MLVRFNQNLIPITNEENYNYNNIRNDFSILSEFVTNLDECVSNYRPSSKYRREIITRYNQPVNIIRDMETQLFASRNDYSNAKIEEFAVKFGYSALRIGFTFLCQFIKQKNNNSKKTVINGNSNLNIEMKSNIFDMSRIFNSNRNRFEYELLNVYK